MRVLLSYFLLSVIRISHKKFIKSIKIGHIWQMKNYIIFDIDRKNTHDKSILLYA